MNAPGIPLRRLGAEAVVIVASVSCLFALAACTGTQPAPEAEPDTAQTRPADYIAADADFMRNMIGHHMQAIDMSRLAPDRTTRESILLLARRIEESQVYEIGLMTRWLEARDEPLEGPHGHDAMAGMATPEQMEALAAAQRGDFDRMFLSLMIRHHEGALEMLDTLHAAEGGGQELEVFTLTSHIDADQRAEIARMTRMLETMEGGE